MTPATPWFILEEPTFPGCHIKARPVGVFLMRDEEGVDAKLLCVPASDPRSNSVHDLEDIPEHVRMEIAHFFDIYKDLEPGKSTEPAVGRPRPRPRPPWRRPSAATRSARTARRPFPRTRRASSPSARRRRGWRPGPY